MSKDHERSKEIILRQYKATKERIPARMLELEKELHARLHREGVLRLQEILSTIEAMDEMPSDTDIDALETHPDRHPEDWEIFVRPSMESGVGGRVITIAYYPQYGQVDSGSRDFGFDSTAVATVRIVTLREDL